MTGSSPVRSGLVEGDGREASFHQPKTQYASGKVSQWQVFLQAPNGFPEQLVFCGVEGSWDSELHLFLAQNQKMY